jgi:hypothetical protein
VAEWLFDTLRDMVRESAWGPASLTVMTTENRKDECGITLTVKNALNTN